MSDYKRFVAYLYEYQNQAKGENRGFVRVEARNGTCQMGFQLKVFSLPEGSALNVYGFVRIQESLFGIPIGILHSGRNGIAGRLMTPSVHMGDSSFSLNELGGLIIFGPEDRVYATQWDDIPIHPEQFTTDTAVLHGPADSSTVSPETAQDSVQTENSGSESAQQPAQSNSGSDNGQESSQTNSGPANGQGPSQANSGSANELEPSQANSGPANGLDPSQVNSSPANGQDPSQVNSSPANEQDPSQANSGPANKQAPQADSGSGGGRNFAQPDQTAPAEAADNPEESLSEKELHIASVEAAEPPVILSSPAERWQTLLESSPHIHPFDDDEISECIRIDLKDLPLLRKNGWQVGSNQFLLHGFYNYHHLLMGRLSAGKQDTFVFGVPGIYDVKEQFMAGMFGFSAFKPARNTSDTAGVSPFGYWYRPVQ